MAEFQFQNRREFVKYLFGTGISLCTLPMISKELLRKKDIVKLTLLYTNDLHSRIDPFPINDPKFPDKGGFARRASIINKIRSEEDNVLLLDAGDIFQGTPYFNLFKGELEYRLMSKMGYDCVTLGNHDFDLGIENIVKQLPHASFDFVSANYDFSNTDLHGKIKQYKIINKSGVKIGIFGLGIELDGLVSKKLYQDTVYSDPINTSKLVVKQLKQVEGCDLVICLSHLGFKSEDKKINDQILASETNGIDLIIGGHTHTFLETPVEIKNNLSKVVRVSQVGWGGIWLGRFDIYFSMNSNKKSLTSTIIDLNGNNLKYI